MTEGYSAANGHSEILATSWSKQPYRVWGFCSVDLLPQKQQYDMGILKNASETLAFDGQSPAHRRRLRPSRAVGGYDPAHRRRLRPIRGPIDGDLSEDSDAEKENATDALPSGAANDIILPIPFASTSCATCLQRKKGDFILLNLNAATQHARSHHCGVGVKYSCNTCGNTYKSKHAAQCHVPKCTGPPTGEAKTGICKQGFKTQRGLSQHERLIHPSVRNEKREKAATYRVSRGTNKGYGKLWQKEEVDIMIRLEKSLQGHPQIVKQMMEHLPGKTAKQIRDKRKEPSYKALMEQCHSTSGHPRTVGPLEIICSSSDSETEIRPVTTKRYVSETEDESSSDQGQASRQPGHPFLTIGHTSLAHVQLTEQQQPGLTRLAGEGPNPSRTKAADQQAAGPQCPIGAGGTPGDEDGAEQRWRTDIIRQTLAETRENSTLSSKCRDFHHRLVSMLTDIGDEQLLATQALVDDVYAQVLAQIESAQATRAAKTTKRKGPTAQASCKRKWKRYRYARTQDLFRKNPKLLARYIREGVSWLEGEDSSSPKPEDVKSFYSSLWGASPNITISFPVIGFGRKALDIGEVFQASTARDINKRLKYTRHNTASGPDGIQRKHITGLDIK